MENNVFESTVEIKEVKDFLEKLSTALKYSSPIYWNKKENVIPYYQVLRGLYKNELYDLLRYLIANNESMPAPSTIKDIIDGRNKSNIQHIKSCLKNDFRLYIDHNQQTPLLKSFCKIGNYNLFDLRNSKNGMDFISEYDIKHCIDKMRASSLSLRNLITESLRKESNIAKLTHRTHTKQGHALIGGKPVITDQGAVLMDDGTYTIPKEEELNRLKALLSKDAPNQLVGRVQTEIKKPKTDFKNRFNAMKLSFNS